MKYYFSYLSPDTVHDALLYVKKNEMYCVNLAEILIAYTKNSNTPLYAAEIYKTNTATLKGVVLLSAYGIVLHCIDYDVPDEILKQFAYFFFRKYGFSLKIHAIAGLAHATHIFEQSIEKNLGFSVSGANDYFLMSRICAAETHISERYSSSDTAIHIRRAHLEDIDALFPLQLAYEQIEVACEGRPVQPAVCRLALVQNLKKRCMYIALCPDCIIAKAAVNAQGSNTRQIGGVYTALEYRNKGVATSVIESLLNDQCVKKTAVLFVKTGNTAAIQVYKKLQFKMIAYFRMSYFYEL